MLRRSSRVPPQARETHWDFLLYAGSSVFAVLLAVVTNQPAHRQWAEMAAGPYAVGAGLSWWLGRRSGLISRARKLILRYLIGVALLVSVVVVPLGLEVAWQQDCTTCIHEQPEVAAIMRAAGREYADQPLYRLAGSNFAAYFPYLPAMAFFGAPAALRRASWTDPRIVFSAVGAASFIGALLVLRVRGPTRFRAGQILLVAPTFALAAVTGGDDLPVIGLMLLALACLQARKPIGTGLAFGAAAMLKLTAWPLGPLLLLGARSQRWSKRQQFLALLAAIGPISGSLLFSKPGSPAAVIANVLYFPLGLSAAHSPAASPLPGEILASQLGRLGHRIASSLLLFVEAGTCVLVWRRRMHRTTSDLAWWLAAAMLIAIMFSSASRFGYLIYPVDLAVLAVITRLQPESACGPVGPWGTSVELQRQIPSARLA